MPIVTLIQRFIDAKDVGALLGTSFFSILQPLRAIGMRGKSKKKRRKVKGKGNKSEVRGRKSEMFADRVGLSAKKESRDYGNLCSRELEEEKN